jgi:hypothetical protein
VKLARGWIIDLSPTLRAVIDERGTIVFTRHGTSVFTVNAGEARKLEQAIAAVKETA